MSSTRHIFLLTRPLRVLPPWRRLKIRLPNHSCSETKQTEGGGGKVETDFSNLGVAGSLLDLVESSHI